MNAVDGDPLTGWEAGGDPFPYELQLDFPTTHTLRGYILSHGLYHRPHAERLGIWVSPHGADWRRLQRMVEGTPWKINEVRQYEVEPTDGVRSIKMIITGTDNKSILRLYEFRPIFEFRSLTKIALPDFARCRIPNYLPECTSAYINNVNGANPRSLPTPL